jgi:putative glutamine amidotransferase
MAFIPSFYIDAVELSGGVAVLVPPQKLDSKSAKTILDGLDGLIVTGGRDVDPSRYGQRSELLTDEPDTLRDQTEIILLESAINMNLPFLGICRGAQLLNVARGGSLIQHLPDVVGTEKYQISKGVFNPVAVKVSKDSKLAGIVGEEVSNAMMYHHQAVDQLGDGLVVTAVSEDGVVEALEFAGNKFGVAVQWHPEQDLDDLRIFQAFIKSTIS